MKIEIDNSTYIFLLISFLGGYFEYMFLLLIIIFIHESGHYFFGKLLSFKYNKIIIYPFGGITKNYEELNTSSNKELFVLFGGIFFQILFILLIHYLYNYGFVMNNTYNIFIKINILLIEFNFMPIIPLDGGRLLNIIFDKFFSYYNSIVLSLIISMIFIIIFIIINHDIFTIIMALFLFKEVFIEYQNINYKYNRFLLERYLNNYSFNKIIKINNIKEMKRDNYHIINNEFENNILSKIFDRSI